LFLRDAERRERSVVSSCDFRFDSERDSANWESQAEEELLSRAAVNASEAYVITVR
jgi:hypothetical protein